MERAVNLKMHYRYRPDIDGLRALAILPVILFHAGFGCSGGFVGVDVFFVISGFLITSLILKEIGNDDFSLVAFWERRIRRILPALFVVAFATLVAGWFLCWPQDFDLLGKSAIAQATLMSNVFFFRHTDYFAAGVDTMPLLHTWSLAVEEQFYVLFPLLLISLARFKRLSIARTIFILCICSLAFSVFGSYYRPSATFYLLPSRAWELMIGGFLAAIHGRQLSNSWLNETAALSGFVLIVYSILCYTRETRFPGLAAIPPCLGAGLIIFSGNTKPTLVSRVLAFRPVVFVGLISYSLYLWHWPLLVFLRYISMETPSWKLRVVLLLFSVMLAILSWKYIETPFRKRLICRQRSQVFAFAGLSMLALLICGGGIYIKHGLPFRFPADILSYYNFRNDRALLNEISLQQAAAGQFAELGAQNTNQPIDVLLWGDSHAMVIAPVIDKLCRQFSVRGVEATHSATLPILGYNGSYKYSLMAAPPAFSKSVVEFIATRHIKTVIIAAHWTVYDYPDLVKTKLTATVRNLISSGARVYVLKDVPIPGFDVPRHVAMTALYQGDFSKLEISPDKHVAANQDYESIFNHLSQMGATVLDTPKYFLNTRGYYDVVRDDKVLYCDESHLSISGSQLLYPMFEPLFVKTGQTRPLDFNKGVPYPLLF